MRTALTIFKKLSLGLLLLAGSAALLLWADLGSRQSAKMAEASQTARPFRVAIVRHASQPAIDDGLRGLIEGLASRGFQDGARLQVQHYNAEADIPTANTIAKDVVSRGYDLIITLTTPSMQTVANANHTSSKTKHVFGLVSDPYSTGTGISRENHLEHPPYMTGYGSMQPVAEGFKLARQMRPELKRIGVVWNPTESNSLAQITIARTTCKELGIELLEANAESSIAVAEAAGSIVSRGVEAIWIGGDVTVLAAADAVIATARRAKIPVFTSIPPYVDKGALFDLGADYPVIGRAVGELAADVLEGRNPAEVPVENLVPVMFTLNKTALAGLKDTWLIPADVAARAQVTIDETGRHVADRAVDARPLPRKMRLDLIEYLDTPNVDVSREGFLAGLKQAGLIEDRDYTIRRRNAQGDIAILSSMVDAAITEGTDLLVASTTPVLQMTLRRGKGHKTVFMLIANPMIAGAGNSETDHLPFVTGAYLPAPHAEALALLKRLLPATKRIGTLFVPAEVNSVWYKEELEKVAKPLGMTVTAVGVATSGEVPDAAMALLGRGLDVYTQISDNLTGASFTSVAEAAKRYKVPLIGFASLQASKGAFMTVSRDFYDGGIESGLMAARVLRGENPATMPFRLVTKIKYIYNLPAAQKFNITIPDDLLKQAGEIIR